MLLMVLAGINVAVFHLAVFRRGTDWASEEFVPVVARLLAASSIAIWIGVMLAGRWIGHIV